MEVQRVLLGLHPTALADPVPAGVALRDDVGYAGRLGRGEQVIGPLGAQPVGGGEPPIHVPHIGHTGDRGHLVHDHVRSGRGHRLTDRHRIQPVHHDGIGAQLLQHAQLARARRRRRHLVATGHQLRHQPPPHDPGPACHEHPHNHHLPESGLGSQPEDEIARRPVTRGCVPGFPRPHDRHAREARDRSAAAMSLQPAPELA